MTESSRLATTTAALAVALETLGDALALARPDAIAASEAALETRTLAFRIAAAAAVACGAPTTPVLPRLTVALARCRRLGFSLSRLAGPTLPSPDALHGYTPVGRPLSSADGGLFLTARG